MLLAVSMKGVGACPTFAIHASHAIHLPEEAVGDQHFDGVFAILAIPQDQQTHRMLESGNTDGPAKIPLALSGPINWLTALRSDARGHFTGHDLVALEENLAIKLQIADITALLRVNVIEEVD